MTEITVLEKRGRLVGFDATGHTGYAEEGEDIVCAAVSAITQTAVIGITEVIKAPCALDISDGELHLMLERSVKGKQLEQAELIIGTMLAGLRSIETDYSDYLKLEKREV